MTNLEKFIEVMNNTFDTGFKPERMNLTCCPCGVLKKPEYACRFFHCEGCKRWWHKEYADPKELSKDGILADCETVRQKLGKAELLAQLAEECNELGKAALKLRRVLDGANPTPVPKEEAEANLQEEIADVLGCVGLIGFIEMDANAQIYRKMKHWVKRLEARDSERN